MKTEADGREGTRRKEEQMSVLPCLTVSVH